MKLPGFPSLIGKHQKHPEVFLSLLLYPDAVEAAIWEVGPRGIPTILGAVTQDIVQDTWAARTQAADKCITTLEELAHTTNLQKVILGFPAPYLTKDGDVIKEIRPYVKKLTHELGLVAIGFVSIYQSLVHKYKKDEGVPPSLILLGFTAGAISVTLYRVGNFVGQITIPKEGSISEHLEDAFAQFPNSTVLPSRMLLYGTKPEILESAKRELLKHHWTARSNFIHFPKIEIVHGDGCAIAVSFAGAGELTQTIEDVPQEETDIELPPEDEPVEEEDIRIDDAEEAIEDVTETVEGDEDIVQEAGSVPDESGEDIEEGEEIIEEAVSDEEMDNIEHANVIAVDPETLGFTKEEDPEDTTYDHHSVPVKKSSFHFPRLFRSVKKNLSSLSKKTPHRETIDDTEQKKAPWRIVLLLIPLVLILLGGYYVLDTILPKATVSITTIPKTVEQSGTITIDPAGTSVTGSTIPGKKKEQSESGDKTVPATGKKTVGEAAHGTITILNKSTVPKTFKKGTVVSASGMDFTLDTDVSIASASETFQGITYSKEDVKVTAKQIGTKGNISAGKDFTISGMSSSIASGRNDQAFSSGTSKDVTVVARADQEQIVKELTTELTQKAKEGFEASGGEMLISETIKTTVTEKTFSAEIGQEAKEVSGKVTVTISGIGYMTSDVTTLLQDKVKGQVSQGYILSTELPKVETGSPTIAKDGTITLTATITASSIPDLQPANLAGQIAGKNTADAKSLLTALPGVGNVDFAISSLVNKNRLPKKPQNITLRISNKN